jgi:SAM-dependent methyltransferase
MSQLYTSGRYAEANPDWHAADGPRKVPQIAALMQQSALRPRSVVDVGCGTGDVLRNLKKLRDAQGHLTTDYEGWDIAKRPLQRARQSEGQRLSFVRGDYLRSERMADLVLCLDTFEHVTNDVQFLKALRSRGRCFLFRIPLDTSVWSSLRPARAKAHRLRYGHLHSYNRERAHRLLTSCGYEIEAEVYDRLAPPLLQRRQRWMDRLRRATFAVSPHRAVRWLGGWSLLVVAAPSHSPTESVSSPSVS